MGAGHCYWLQLLFVVFSPFLFLFVVVVIDANCIQFHCMVAASHTAMFEGNIDDCFKIGIGVSRKAVKLYCDFYSSDIIVASPLGLRTVIGAEG